MYCIKFKISLKSPLIISGNDKTEVNLNCLDYIPGNIFLGMAAGSLYRPNGDNHSEILDYFHNGNVQFGNAYLSVDDEASKPVPAVWYKNKGEQLDTGIYFYHQLEDENFRKFAEDGIQIKQERNGYFIEKDGDFTIINAQKGVVLKSAYDSKRRSAESGQMYLYEYLEAGQTFIFEVNACKKEYLENLLPIFKGNKHISKSKTAEFGAVYFEQIGGIVLVKNEPINLVMEDDSVVTIYAKSNLAFINDFGAFTWSPTALDLGFENATINYGKSQLHFDKFHTRNGKRRTHDGDRLIIKKGSVFVLECTKETTIKKNANIEKGIGVYLSEGYGKIMVNATFLDGIKEASIIYYDWNVAKDKSKIEVTESENKYVLVFKERLKKEKEQQEIYTSVCEFIGEQKNLYKGISSSQWGAIRSLVYRAKQTENPNESVYDFIFKYVENETNTNKSGYILHGRMGEKWVGNKRKALLYFLKIVTKDANGKEIKETTVTDLNIEKLLLLSIEFPKRLKE